LLHPAMYPEYRRKPGSCQGDFPPYFGSANRAVLYFGHMHTITKVFISAAAVGVFALTLPSALFAAAPESFLRESRIEGPVISSFGDASIQLQLPGVNLKAVQENDPGTAEIVDTLFNPNNRRYVMVSVRVGQPNAAGILEAPFVTKIYQYDILTSKLKRIYRSTEGTGYEFLGFDGGKLVLKPEPAGGAATACQNDYPYPTKLPYLNTYSPALGVRTYVAKKAFYDLQAKLATAKCPGVIY